MPILPAEPDVHPLNLWQLGGRGAPDEQWWCLHTKPRQEKAVARALKLRDIAYYLPQVVKVERRDRLMAVQQPIAFAFNEKLIGRTLDVLIDRKASEGKHLWIGRPYTDAPDVDGITWVQSTRLNPGDLVGCEIVGTDQYDLIARPVSADPPRRRKLRPRPRSRPHSPLAILDNM